MKVVIGIWKIKPNRREDFIVESEAVSEASKDEKGLVSYSFSESRLEENTFVFFEEWRDDEAIVFHTSQPYFMSFIENTKDMLIEDFKGTVYSVSGTAPF